MYRFLHSVLHSTSNADFKTFNRGEFLVNFSSEWQYFDLNNMWNSIKMWNSITTGQKSSESAKTRTLSDWKVVIKICGSLEWTLSRHLIVSQSIFGVQSRTKTLYQFKGHPARNTSVDPILDVSFPLGSLVVTQKWVFTIGFETRYTDTLDGDYFWYQILSTITGDALLQRLRHVTSPRLPKSVKNWLLSTKKYSRSWFRYFLTRIYLFPYFFFNNRYMYITRIYSS